MHHGGSSVKLRRGFSTSGSSKPTQVIDSHDVSSFCFLFNQTATQPSFLSSYL